MKFLPRFARSSMKTAAMSAPVSKLIFASVIALATGGALAACSEDEPQNRPSFPDPDSSSGPEASLPPTEKDAGYDATEPRPAFDPADVAVSCAGQGACATQLVAGSNHFCVLMSDGTVRCWGSDEYGALGTAPKGEEDKPVRVVSGISGATQISAARSTTCARLSDGKITCWGSNSFGQLGLSAARPMIDENRHPEPSLVDLAEPAARVDVGEDDVCATLADGKVYCWGNNELQQLARDAAFAVGPGLAEIAPTTIAQVRVGSTTMVALTTTGEVVSWGATAGREGFLSGRFTSIHPDRVPATIPQLSGATNLAVMASLYPGQAGPMEFAPGGRHGHACAIKEGEVYCWGRTGTGALCTGVPEDSVVPKHAPVRGKAWPQRLALGEELTCARMTDGSIQCCGADAKGRLGGGAEKLALLLTPVSSFRGNAVSVAASYRAVCALVKDGTVDCWGSNVYGELGNGTPDEDRHATPLKVAF